MVSPEDIVEIAWEVLRESPPKAVPAPQARQGKWGELISRPFNAPWTSLRSGRMFISEREIRLRLADGSKELRVPRSAILSLLAQDWMWEKGVKVVYE